MVERYKIADGLRIFETADPCSVGSVRAEHDVIIGADRTVTAKLTGMDKGELHDLGWVESAEYDGWIYRL